MTIRRAPLARLRRAGRFVLLTALTLVAGCDAPGRPPTPPVPIATPAPRSGALAEASARTDSSVANAERTRADAARPRRDLAHDEAQGGHTIARHVGRSDADLRARLRRDPGISAASTYTDLPAAEHAIADALAASGGTVRRWEGRSGSRPNLVVDYTASAPVGRTLRRGARASEPCAHAVVVLRWHNRDEHAYVLTSYPECGR